MKVCPYCAERIQDKAIVCRYCGRDLPPRSQAVAQQAGPTPDKRLKWQWRKAAIVAGIVSVAGAISGLVNYRHTPVELLGKLAIVLPIGFLFFWLVAAALLAVWPIAGRASWARPMIAIAAVLGLLAVGAVGTGLVFPAHSSPPASTPANTSVPSPSRSTATSTIDIQGIPLLAPPPVTASDCVRALDVDREDVGKMRCVFGTALYVEPPLAAAGAPSYACQTDASKKCNNTISFAPPGPPFFNISKLRRITAFYLTTMDYGVNVGDCVMAFGVIKWNDNYQLPCMIGVADLYYCPDTLQH